MSDPVRARSGLPELVACLALSFVFGTVHSFSTWLAVLEAELGIGRAAASLSYSISLVAVTTAVFFGGRIYHRARPVWIGLISLALGLVGLAIAASNLGLWAVWLGFGVVFGFANGIGYGFALQFAAVARPHAVGFAMGAVTASYAAGAMSMSNIFAYVSSIYGAQGVMGVHALLLIAVAPIVFFTLRNTSFVFPKGSSSTRSNLHGVSIGLIWLAYGLAVSSGLMLISQASEVMRWSGAKSVLIAAAPAYLATLNLAGALLGGVLVDRMSDRNSISLLPLGTALALVALILAHSVGPALAALLSVGFFYGATIAVYPAVIARKFGAANSTFVYGRVFTAWGLAGLLAPFIAGWSFDASGSYLPALYMAAGGAVLSALAARRI